MKPRHPNVAKVELVAHALGDLRKQLVFVGGCAVDLLLTDTAAAPTRVTYDVDLVAQVAALAGYHKLEEEFIELGFKRDMSEDAPICRWRLGHLEDIINVLDGRPEIIGEIALSQIELQHYLADRCSALLATPNFMDALQGMVFPDESLAERVQMLSENFKLIARGVEA